MLGVKQTGTTGLSVQRDKTNCVKYIRFKFGFFSHLCVNILPTNVLVIGICLF
jgi:hypothetical protein